MGKEERSQAVMLRYIYKKAGFPENFQNKFIREGIEEHFALREKILGALEKSDDPAGNRQIFEELNTRLWGLTQPGAADPSVFGNFTTSVPFIKMGLGDIIDRLESAVNMPPIKVRTNGLSYQKNAAIMEYATQAAGYFSHSPQTYRAYMKYSYEYDKLMGR